MGFLALEATGSLPLTIAVLGAVVVSALTVRRLFGYSFATWRFHLRGEAIRSAVDVGWMRNLTVGRMMRREVRTVRAETPLSSFRRDFPLGSTQRVVVLDADDRYAGIVYVAEAHADEADGHKVSDVLHQSGDMLLPQMTIKEAISAFERAESDALAVVDGPEARPRHRPADRAARAAPLQRGAGSLQAGAVGRVGKLAGTRERSAVGPNRASHPPPPCRRPSS